MLAKFLIMVKKIKKVLFFRRKVLSLVVNRKPIKINIGSGKDSYNEWLYSDIGLLDVTKKIDWFLCLWPFKATNIMAEHVWEHLEPAKADIAIQNCYKNLKSGGNFRIAVPDGFFPNAEYIEMVKPGGIGAGAEDHKVLYDFESLSNILQKHGFSCNLIEYWDKNGEFIFRDWNEDKGMIKRSRFNDKRNDTHRINYTSLIIDARKI
jgi:predicted SAM-dependent methyltransferase